MKGLRNKLKDQSGASILLALLFFLLCCMVGASVLMASASNAGKIRSNRESQQEYLLLSSALRLVCGELTSAEYYGKYTYETWEEEIVIDYMDDGTPIPETHTYHEYTQETGELKCDLSTVIPLTEELDFIFASKFPASYVSGLEHYIYKPKSGSFISGTHEITLRVNTTEADGLGDDQVTVKVQMDQDLRIRLTATLGEETDDGYVYTMEAQLTGQGAGSLNLAGANEGVNEAGPVTWALEWIAKKEAGDGT